MNRILTAAALLAITTLAHAQNADQADLNPGEQVLKRVADLFAEAQSFSVTVNMDINIDAGGQKQNDSAVIKFAVRKPDKFRVHFSNGETAGLTVSNGQTVHTHMEQFNQYTEQPANRKAPLQNELMGVLLNSALIAENPYAALTEPAKSVTLRGTTKVDDVECDVVRMPTDEGVVDLYVRKQGQPLPMKVEVDQSPMLKAAGRDGTIKVTMRYTDWTIDQPIADEQFAFTAPEGSRKVSQFGPPKPSDVLVGKPAPEIELTTLDGKAFKLSELKGKVVVLDFWATWCGPCVRGLPAVKKATEELADKGVVLYTVNQREGEDKINAFLEQHELTGLNVLLDRKAEAANAYKVQGIPQTVIIDADGVVQVVHVGFAPGMENTLRSELESVLAEAE